MDWLDSYHTYILELPLFAVSVPNRAWLVALTRALRGNNLRVVL